MKRYGLTARRTPKATMSACDAIKLIMPHKDTGAIRELTVLRFRRNTTQQGLLRVSYREAESTGARQNLTA